MAAEQWSVIALLILQNKISLLVLRVCQVKVIYRTFRFSVSLHTGRGAVLTAITFFTINHDTFHNHRPLLYVQTESFFHYDLL